MAIHCVVFLALAAGPPFWFEIPFFRTASFYCIVYGLLRDVVSRMTSGDPIQPWFSKSGETGEFSGPNESKGLRWMRDSLFC